MSQDIQGTRSQKWRIFTGLALLAGLLLWFFYLTDYTLAGTIIDIVFPFVALVLGLVAFPAARGATTRRGRRLARVAALPASLGGLLYIAVGLLFVAFSPMAAMFTVYEIADEGLIQSAPSPDGSRVAEVYFRGVGPYTGGNGRIFVRVKHRLFPVVERDIYSGKTYEAGSDTEEYLSWTSDDTLYIPEANAVISLGAVKGRVPDIVNVPIRLFEFMGQLEEWKREEEVATEPLKDLPKYPGSLIDDYSGGGVLDNNGYRAFSIASTDSDEAAAWYKQELSKGPWKVEESERLVRKDQAGAPLHPVTVIYNCLETRRDEGNGQSRMYYWQIFIHDDMEQVRIIVETPDKPGVWHCDEYP